MNLNEQQSRKSDSPPRAHGVQSSASGRRSAAPQEFDTRGHKQQPRQYISEEDAQLNRIKSQYPSHIKHKDYKQPQLNKNGMRSFFVLALIVFLLFSLSLLAVYGIAVAVKNATTPEGTQQSDTTSVDSGINGTTDSTAPDTSADTPPAEPPSVYASATPETVTLTSEIGSTNAILIDLGSFEILAQKGADTRIYPASMTKIMTLLVGVENMSSLDQKATVTKQTYDYCYTQEASVAGFLAGEEVTVEDLLYGVILPSGADATMTLAECIAGSEEAFVRLMNSKAAELGLKNTHFVNTSGLHDANHYSTVHDIAIILKAAMSNVQCYKILSANHYITSETTQHPTGISLYSIVHTRTSSIKSSDFTVVGGKTGYTPEANQCLATYAISTVGNREYIFVSANAPDRITPVNDAEFAYTTYIE